MALNYRYDKEGNVIGLGWGKGKNYEAGQKKLKTDQEKVRKHQSTLKNKTSGKKLTYEERQELRKKRMREDAAKRNKQFEKDKKRKKAGKKTSYEGYKSAYDKRQSERKEALKIRAKKKHEAWKEKQKKKKDVKAVVKQTKKYNDKKYNFWSM